MTPGNMIYESNTTFADRRGSPEVLRGCVEVVSFLNDQDRFVSMGTRIPKGILLEGWVISRIFSCHLKHMQYIKNIFVF